MTTYWVFTVWSLHKVAKDMVLASFMQYIYQAFTVLRMEDKIPDILIHN